MNFLKVLISVLLFSSSAFANPVMHIFSGPSIPETDAEFGLGSEGRFDLEQRLTRKSGGAIYSIAGSWKKDSKKAALGISSVQIVAYSKSGKGGVLVRDASAHLALKSNNTTKQASISLNPLMIYSQRSSTSRAQEKDGLVFLGHRDFVRYDVAEGQTLNDLKLQVEGFGDNDASVLMQVTYEPAPADREKMINVRTEIVADRVPKTGGRSGGSSGGGSGGGRRSDGSCEAACSGLALAHFMQCQGSQTPDMNPHYCSSMMQSEEASCSASCR